MLSQLQSKGKKVVCALYNPLLLLILATMQWSERSSVEEGEGIYYLLFGDFNLRHNK